MLSFKESMELMEASAEEFDTLSEAMTMQQRLAASRAFKKVKHKVKLGRERAMRKTATADVLQKRAYRAARKKMFLKLSKGEGKDSMSFSQRQMIEKRLDKLQAKIKLMAKKMVPDMRRVERERKAHKADK